MSQSASVTLTQEESGRVLVQWERELPRRESLLSERQLVRVGDEDRPLSNLGPLRLLRRENLDALGALLGRALRVPALTQGDMLTVKVGPAWLRALPWHLTRDVSGGLVARGVDVRVDPVPPPDQRPLGLHVHVLSVDLRPAPPDVSTRDHWEATLDDLLGQSGRVDGEETRLPPSLVPLDVLHVLVENAAPGQGLRLLEGPEWPALPRLLADQPPYMLILECGEPADPSLVRLAADLAEHVPCVVLACAPTPTDAPLSDFTTGPRLLATMLRRELAPCVAARVLDAEERRAGARSLWVWGGGLPPRPARTEHHGPWYYDDGWRLSLDRVDQTFLAMGFIRKADRDRDRGPDAPSTGVVLVWHGPPHSGLSRFLSRLQWESEHEERVACELVGLSWPEVPSEPDWAAHYQGIFHVAPTRDDGPRRAALSAAIYGYVEAALNQRQSAHHGRAVLVFHHGELHLDLGSARVAPDVLADYARWWAQVIAPAAPRSVVPVLALCLRASEQDLYPGRVEQALRAVSDDLRPVELCWLPALPDIQPGHVVTHIERFGLMPGSSLAERKAVAAVICARTGGRYEPSIKLIEQIPWTRASLLLASRTRQSTP